MKHFILLSAAAILSGALPVQAADLPYGALPLAPPPLPTAFTWTGFYAGVNAGAGFADGKSNTVPNSSWYTTGNANDLASANGIAGAGHRDLSTAGFLGGLQLGYNYQYNNLVFGLEEDFDANSLSKSASASFSRSTDKLLSTVDQSYKSDWLATIRPRVGYAFGQALLYATGGVAFTNFKASGNEFPVTNAVNYLASSSSTLAGLAIGGGVEYAIMPRWTVKAEYLYTDFGKTQFTGNRNPTNTIPYAIAYKTYYTENVARLGVNYKF